MVYFIFWAILILAAIIAVPVVNTLENRRRLALLPAQPAGEELGDEAMDDGDAAEAGFGDEIEEAEEEPADEFGGGDDFSAFDDEFK